MDGHEDLAGKGYRIPDVRVPGATVIYVSISHYRVGSGEWKEFEFANRQGG